MYNCDCFFESERSDIDNCIPDRLYSRISIVISSLTVGRIHITGTAED